MDEYCVHITDSRWGTAPPDRWVIVAANGGYEIEGDGDMVINFYDKDGNIVKSFPRPYVQNVHPYVLNSMYEKAHRPR